MDRWKDRVALVTGASVGIGAAICKALVQHRMKVVCCGPCDVTQSTLHQGVDVVINNAGLAHPEPLLNGKTDGWRKMIDVKIIALSICTREAYQSMKGEEAVTALTEELRQELREAKTHIRATCISPGMVETEYAFRLHSLHPEKAAATYDNMKCLEAVDIASVVTY
ncbi:unnamed protein product, partial [Coregonus sp. 'balchen']